MLPRRPVDSKVGSGRQLQIATADGYSRFRGIFTRIAIRRSLAVYLTTAVAFTIAVSFTIRVGFPLPEIHDEFSYLLAAETFASGRVALPAASSPAHFETIHELQLPKRVSKYPPAQGLALAVGIWLAKSPRLGVWLTFAAFGGALLWMLQAWAPPTWSLIAALWTILLLGSTTWTYSYWGGAVSALGGALVFGAIGRLRQARSRDAIILTLGVLVLANSRPFEGLLVCIPAAAYLLWWLVVDRDSTLQHRLTRVVVPATLLLVLGAAAMLAYNHATTGNALRFPYMEYEAQKGGAPLFIWGDVSPMRANARATDVYRWEGDLWRFRELHTAKGYSAAMWERFKDTLGTYIPLLAAFPLLLLPWAVRGSRHWAAAAGLGLVALGSATVAWYELHYAAPAVAVLIMLYLRSLRLLNRVMSRRWRSLVTSAVVVVLFGKGLQRFIEPPRFLVVWQSPRHWTRRRAGIEDSLRESGGKHLIFVRYLPSYGSSVEWVYNGSDLVNAPVLWANDLGDAANASLLRSMEGRHGWLLLLGDRVTPSKPRPYEPRDSVVAALTKPAGVRVNPARKP